MLYAFSPSIVMVTAYVLAGLVPDRGHSWRPYALALAPTAVVAWLFGLSVWPGGAAVVIIWIIAAMGMTAHDRIRSGILWIGTQAIVAVVLVGITIGLARQIPLGDEATLILVVGSLIAAGAAVTVEWGGEFVGRAIKPFADKLYDNPPEPQVIDKNRSLPTGIPSGGKTIGRWERLLIFLFVLAGSSAAIGFLVTAKSILRFGEIKDAEHQKEAEYIIIGTLMSFGFALVTSYLIRCALLIVLPDTIVDALSLGNGE